MLRPEVALPLAARCSDKGFKLLLDIVVSSTVPLRVMELPYRFALRTSGKSKLGAGVVWCFAVLLARHMAHRIPRRFVRFCLIGCSGVLVHLSVLWMARRWLQASFPAAQTGAVLASIASNFWLNNRLAFGDVCLRGALFFAGMSQFAALCAVGAVVNVVCAETLYRAGFSQLLSAMAGILAGAACNYVTVSRFVWRT